MIAFPVIVGYEVLNGGPQRRLSEEDQPLQAGLLNAADKSLRVGVQIRGSRRQFHRLHSRIGNRLQKLSGEERIPIVNQVSLSGQDSLLRISQIARDLAHPQSIRGTRDPAIWTFRVASSMKNRTINR